MVDLSLCLLEVIEQLIRGGAISVSLTVSEYPEQDIVKIVIEDNGPGLLLFPRPQHPASLQLALGKSAMGGAAISTTILRSHVPGDLHQDLAAMLSSVVCTSPNLDLRLKFRIGNHEYTLNVHDIAEKIPAGKSGGLSLARQLYQRIKSELAMLSSKHQGKQELNEKYQ